ncbi:hypothetical protein SAMN05421636_101411 [Pricia antarctica]|uniref:Heme-degrading monooxygenase HmoA n=1 Tax=Pricia antarctica TaxID=641691 RepID=A0A1G6WUM7_9FLAO|nr:hypothetical protein SAMN05421636_101411 [Pricia antarctica]
MLGMTPYYVVIFTSTRTDGDNGYAKMADEMEKLAKQQQGYLGIESARDEVGITVSYWESLEAIASHEIYLSQERKPYRPDQ